MADNPGEFFELPLDDRLRKMREDLSALASYAATLKERVSALEASLSEARHDHLRLQAEFGRLKAQVFEKEGPPF
jgi:predicted  nucleic acid-binding Zn-ribbon protein